MHFTPTNGIYPEGFGTVIAYSFSRFQCRKYGGKTFIKGGFGMKKMALISLAFLVALLLSFSAQAKNVVDRVNAGTYCTEGLAGYDSCSDETFATKFWKEKFFGGGPGQAGNVLMAIGQGFTLQNVVLETVEGCASGDCGLPPDHPCLLNGATYNYKTIYTGGFLRLNKGPRKLWVNKGKLKATDLTVTNYSTNDAEGLLHFCLVMEGPFTNAPEYSYDIIATFDVEDDNYQIKYDDEGNQVFHRGYDFDAIIEISPTPPVGP
jgi:hypothetical protein